MLGQKYADLYENYYTDKNQEKRELTAIETMGHIRRLIGGKKFDKIVDIGAGQGALIGFLHKAGVAKSLTALEISSSGLEQITARDLPEVTAAQFDGYKSEFADKTFDMAFSIHVLEHVEHERMYLKELGRISKQAIIEVPLELMGSNTATMATMAPYGHINSYRRITFENLLNTCGFTIKKIIVNTVTPELDIHMSGKVKGRMKNWIRRSALTMNETFAERHFVYLCTALVDCPE